MRPKVVYWNNLPAPYMVDRFNALVDRGNLDFEAWFNDKFKTDRSWAVDEASWHFRYRYLPATRIGDHIIHWPLPVFGRRPDVLVSLYAKPVFIIGWMVARIRRVKTGFRVVKTYDRWEARHPVKEAIKRYLFRRVDAVETPGNDGKHFAMHYGTPPSRIFFATHTVDINFYQSSCRQIRPQRGMLREANALKGVTFIYVGRLWWGKGVKVLLEAFEAVQRQGPMEVSLLLVGDGPDEALLKQMCSVRGIRNVVFAGFKQKPELPTYYTMSDVFVFPTLGDPYGLVVDEAMACSLPVISTSEAGEIRERVKDGVNGYIVPPDDSAALATRMLELAENIEMRSCMGKISAEMISGHTPQQWAEDFERIIGHLVSADGQ